MWVPVSLPNYQSIRRWAVMKATEYYYETKIALLERKVEKLKAKLAELNIEVEDED